MSNPNQIERSQLRAFFKQHLGVKLRCKTLEEYLTRTRVDVEQGEYIWSRDVDIRLVDTDGIAWFFYNDCERIEYAEMTAIRIRRGEGDEPGQHIAVVDRLQVAA